MIFVRLNNLEWNKLRKENERFEKIFFLTFDCIAKVNENYFFFIFPVHELVHDHVLLPVGADPEVVAVDGGVEVGVLQLLSCTFLGISV